MLDRDLAMLYQAKAIALRQAVKRHRNRFPEGFVFQLSRKEAEILVSQTVIPSRPSFGGALPYVFTEQGVAMLSSLLRSQRAVLVNVQIMRTFVRLRQMLIAHADLHRRLDELESKYDSKFRVVFEAIRQLMEPPAKPRKHIGFAAERRAS